MTSPLDASIPEMQRKLRIIGILDASRSAGLEPVGILVLHTVAYLCDALAPVWRLPILDAQVLKRRERPFFPRLQTDVDLLVGQGVVTVSDVSYEHDESGWRLEGRYALRREASDSVLSAARQFESRRKDLAFVREVVYAASGLGERGLMSIGSIDAAYSDPVVDVGGIVEMDASGQPNPTARAAFRLGELSTTELDVSDAELVHLYVRHLYSRLSVA